MRIAVISDMHGNAVAFDAVLDDMRNQGIDQTVCLGDALQGGPQPAAVLERLQALGCPVVLGNADALVLTGTADDGHPVTAYQRAVRDWSAEQLGERGLDAIRSFQPTVTLDLPARRKLLCFHGSPASYNDIIGPETSQDELERMLGPHLPALQCGGHTHHQQLRRIGDSYFFNPGSVGLSWNPFHPTTPPPADPWAAYAILTADDRNVGVEFRSIPYNVAALVDIIMSSGMPEPETLAMRYSRR